MKEVLLSNCERSFIIKAISEGTRLDGRNLNEFRKLKIIFGSDWGCCQVSLGETRALAQVSCEVQQPKQTRPNEGLLNINLEMSPMAAPHFELGRMSEECIQVNRMLEKCLKDSRCIDLESLCIVAEEKVWALRVDINILNHEGNIMDCASIAALAALAHFKRPDVTNTGEQIVIHNMQDRDPLPVILHHYPVCVSFALFDESKDTVADPSEIEERAADAQLVLGVNAYRELCGLHLGGSALTSPQLVIQCANSAGVRANVVVQMLKQAILTDTESRTEGKPVGFRECIQQNKITSLAHERISLRLRKWNPNKTPKRKNALNKHIKFDDDGEPIVDNSDEEMDLAEEAPFVENKIKPLGNGCAELLHQRNAVGEGGPSTWENESSSDDDSVNSVMEIHSDVKKEDIVMGTEQSAIIILDDDSEEEETVLLESEIIKKKKGRNTFSTSPVQCQYPPVPRNYSSSISSIVPV